MTPGQFRSFVPAIGKKHSPDPKRRIEGVTGRSTIGDLAIYARCSRLDNVRRAPPAPIVAGGLLVSLGSKLNCVYELELVSASGLQWGY